jgi:hypothetical protein
MKRHGNIWGKICTIENIKAAHKGARKDKLFYKEVKMVDVNEDYYLGKILNMLKDKSYTVGNYSTEERIEGGKLRRIMKLPYYPDRIIQWAIILQLEKIFINASANHTCASMPGRGIHYAYKLMKKYLSNKDVAAYCLKFDVKKFYPSINRDILKKLFRNKFKDKDLTELVEKIIDSAPGGRGVPIGSYLSQYLANFYLNGLDHWLKEEKRVKRVVRYMDDVVILHQDKAYLHGLRREIGTYLSEHLDLELKPNWQVFPTFVRGVDFCGYRFFGDYTLLRKSTAKSFKRKILNLKRKPQIGYKDVCSVNSYMGWIKWSDGRRLTRKYVGMIQDKIDTYQEQIKKRSQKTKEVPA